MKLPSKTLDCYWIGTYRQLGNYPKDTKKGGKWLIFRSIDNIDKIWKIIRLATILGFLGNRSKVSTAKSNPNATNPNTKVICVYTYDSDDRKDVKRIRKELKKIGIKEKIYYKTNKTTLENKYSNKGDKNISKYCS